MPSGRQAQKSARAAIGFGPGGKRLGVVADGAEQQHAQLWPQHQIKAVGGGDALGDFPGGVEGLADGSGIGLLAIGRQREPERQPTRPP